MWSLNTNLLNHSDVTPRIEHWFKVAGGTRHRYTSFSGEPRRTVSRRLVATICIQQGPQCVLPVSVSHGKPPPDE